VRNALAFFKDSYCTPAVQSFTDNGWLYKIRTETYYTLHEFIRCSNKLIHSKMGPAIIYIQIPLNRERIEISYEWWIYGIKVPINDVLDNPYKQRKWEAIQLLLQL
jgi:hypothetical protein